MRIAITGASGYVGSGLAQCLRDAGHEVLAWCRTPQPSPWFHYALGDDPSNLPWEGVDALIHAAHDFKPLDSDEAYLRNCGTAESLFETAANRAVSRILFISSMSAAEGCVSIYGKAKLRVESAAHRYGAVVIRPGLVWGGKAGGVMGGIEKLVGFLPIIPFPDGRPRPSQYLIHRDELAEIVSRLMISDPFPSAQTLIAAHPQPLDLPAIISIIARSRGKHRLTLPIPWRVCQWGLQTAEILGLPLPIRSDSLLGLMHGTRETPVTTEYFGVTLRPFSGN
jgi:nucleoside-diphosphate-sugar epimerase